MSDPAQSPEYLALKEEHAKQGNIVRELKANKGPKEEIDAQVKILIDLKKKMEAIVPPPPKEKKKKEAQGPTKKELRKLARQAEIDKVTAKMSETSLEDTEPDNDAWGRLPLNKSQQQTDRKWTHLKDLNASMEGQEVLVRARLHNSRVKGKAGFYVLRTAFSTAQATLFASKDSKQSPAMVKWSGHIPRESVLDITAVVKKPPEPLQSVTQKDIELEVRTLHIVSLSAFELPFSLEDAMKPPTKEEVANCDADERGGVDQKTRLDNRWLDIRTPANQGIFRIQSAVCQLFREYLYTQEFREIHTPKIIPTASESGASVFKLGYFDDNAYLAQSPQLYKQMALMSDLERVFEIGPVFRAENSNTHRHLCEFTGMDIEMTFNEHYYEVLDVLGDMFIYMFDNLEKRFAHELAAVRSQFHSEPLVYPRKTIRITYSEGIDLLRASGEPDTADLAYTDDLSTPHERLLGRLVKEKYNTDFFIMDKFPYDVRPFYTMKCPQDERFTNSYDLFIRGEEICSGAQRVHDPVLLAEQIKEKGASMEEVQDYVNSFKHGAFPHGGGGIGMERVVFLYLGLTNIRRSSMFPRDPRRKRP
eukprot:TRINITY_DN1222_c0_g1_i2.p2 TRINITY_DN1222_c0_g1~~TRINITY_DN1222_c0_g1_i2.p2  ORF type:complete len:590 (+),score=198.97 TRINITY_DN1222_c0_g1_i2:65-1834(+)